MRHLLVGLFGGAALSGCGCTEVGCLAEIRFNVESPAIQADDGVAYTFVMDVDGETSVCEGVVGQEFDCTNGWIVELATEPGDASLSVVTSRSGRLDEVSLDVERAGAVVFSEVFDADGDPFFPNGRLCEPVCEGFVVGVDW